MKLRIICLLLPLFLLSCSKKPTEAERRSAIQPSPSVPFQITVEETPEAKEQGEIKNQAISFLKNKDYDKLEELAAKYRTSKECYADGIWKLMIAYDAVASGNLSSKSDWEARQKEIQDWIAAKPESPTAQIAMARFLREYAWIARGSGWASTVSDAGWKSFGDRLNQAWDILDGAKNLKEQCPVYWSARLGIALGLQLDKTQFNRIFTQAIRAEPDFQYYYRMRAVYLLPRWYGEEGEWENDLAQSADRIGGEKGDMLYARVVWDIHHYGSSIDVFEGNKISWERVDRGFAAILKQFPDSLAAKNERAHLAGLAGDREKARKYFIQTEGKVDLSAWHAKGEFIDAANWAFAQ
jgi:hypothetical protein